MVSCFFFGSMRQGSQNVIADCILRVPLIHACTAVDSVTELFIEIDEISPHALPLRDFKAECEDFSELTKLWEVTWSGWLKVKKSPPSEVFISVR